MTTKQQRKKRFQRDTSVRFSLTERDLIILEELYKYRFLNSEQLVSLLGGSRQGLLRRLNLLYHGGYLDRPQAQLAWIGNNPIVYGLGNKGAQLVAEKLDLSLSTVDWTSKNREARGLFLEHTLMTAQFLIMVRLACEQVDGIEFIETEKIIERRPVVPAGQAKPLSWRVEADRDHSGQKKTVTFSMVPDSAFGLQFTENGQSKGNAYFFLEADRSTMPIQRSNLVRSSYYKKLVGYWDSWRQELFPEKLRL